MKTMNYTEKKLGYEIFTELRDRIIYLDYAPETVLLEKELCAEFQVSRTPLREAILKLEEMNLVRSIPRFGTYVTHIDTNEVISTYEVKIDMEMQAGSLAAQRRTEDDLKDLENATRLAVQAKSEENIRERFEGDFQFHAAIWRSSHNDVLEKILADLHARCLRFCIATIPPSGWESNSPEEFEIIFEAIKNKDKKKTAELLAVHNRQFIDRIKSSSFNLDR
jgi:DNA-binding GntR family transcriptional regulator